MIKNKNNIGRINITETDVLIDTDINYRAIEIHYTKTMSIKGLMPSYFLIKKSENKILIIKFQENNHIQEELFSYIGECNIIRAYLVDEKHSMQELIINKPALQLWDTLDQDWESLTANWEDIGFEGRNNDIEKLNIKHIRDKEAGTHTITREPVNTIQRTAQKDRLSNKLAGLNTKGQEYKKALNNENYSGKYYIDLTTNKLYTDNNELLIPIKDIKQIRKGKQYGTRTPSNNY
tara:strand:+ start:1460 stop:2164 length:705 start_codon:yes stop_codon:yes gene_type:complete